MANRFPLIFNSGAGQIQELAASDNLDLTSSNLVNAGILFTSSGSATAPSLQIGSGTTYNPGLYSPGTDQLAISTGGTGRLFVDANGKTGINATPPGGNQGLYVSVSSPTADTAGVQVKNASDAALEMLLTGATYSYAGVGANETWLRSSKAGAGSNLNIGSDESMAIKFISNAAERLRITSAGTVNIIGAGTAGSSQAVSFNGSAPINSIVLDSGGKLGLGTSSVTNSANLDIQLDTVSATDTYAKIQLRSGNYGYIIKGGLKQGAGGQLHFDLNNNNTIATMMTLDTGGKLLVGTATSIDSASIIQTVGNSQRNISLKYSGTTGGAETLINFVDKRDVINASIGNNLYDDGIGTATAYLVFKTANAGTLAERMRINGAGDVSIVTGNLIIGTAGKGIDFSADGNAAGMTSELLDDYEEGTWTVGLTADTSGTITTNTQTGSYVKIGRQVTVNGFITVASVSAPVGLLRMTGLPFSLSGTRCAVSIWPHSLSAGAVTSVVGFIQNTESSVVLYNYAAGNGAVDMAGQVQAGTNLAVSATYFV